MLNLNLSFIVKKTSPTHFFPIPMVNHRHSTNLNFDCYGDHCQRGWCRPLRMLNVVTGYNNNTIMFRTEQGTRWWRFQIPNYDTYVRRYEHAKLKMPFFAKIWPLTWPNEVKYWPRTKNNMCNLETSSRRVDCFFFSRSSTTIRGRSPGGLTPSIGEGGEIRKTGEY